MTDVGFETACALVVPQANRAVMCSGQDIFGIRRKLYVLAGGRQYTFYWLVVSALPDSVVPFRECFKTLSRIDVPYSTEEIG